VVNAAGEKLSKQTLAAPVSDHAPVAALLAALAFLGQNPPQALAHASLREVWAWALANWSPARVPHRLQAPAPAGAFRPEG